MNSTAKQCETTPMPYSPFLAVTLVFLTLIILQCCFLWDDYSLRKDMLTTQANLTDSLARAQKIIQITEGITRDIYVRSNDSEEARKIAAEFEIRYANPAPVSK